MKAKQIYENLDFERTGDVLRDTGMGVKRNIPKYHGRLAQEIHEKSAYGNNEKITEFAEMLDADLQEYGYNTLSHYLDLTEEEETFAIPEIENSIKELRWQITEFVKQYVWDSEAIKEMAKTIYYYTVSEEMVETSWIIKSLDKALKLNWDIKESVNFERGLDPKTAISVGHAHLYPDKNLFKRIYQYWETVPEIGWPKEFEELTPIQWARKEPKFKVILKAYKPEESSYTVYLTNEGVVMFYDYYADAGGGRRSYRDEEYVIKDFTHFIRILQSNHVSIIQVKESVNFERGRDPQEAMDIGLLSPIKHKMDQIKDEVDLHGFSKIPLDENPFATGDHRFINIMGWGDENDNYLLLYILKNASSEMSKFRIIGGHWDKYFKPRDEDSYPPRAEDGGIHGWINYKDSENYYNPWDRAFDLNLRESQNFERGMEPLEKMGIGSQDAKMLNKLRSFAERSGWEETDITLPVEGEEIKTLMQWDHPMGNQALLYKLPWKQDAFYEIQVLQKGLYDQEEKYYIENQFTDSDFWENAAKSLFEGLDNVKYVRQ